MTTLKILHSRRAMIKAKPFQAFLARITLKGKSKQYFVPVYDVPSTSLTFVDYAKFDCFRDLCLILSAYSLETTNSSLSRNAIHVFLALRTILPDKAVNVAEET